jgi:hypothetical protein
MTLPQSVATLVAARRLEQVPADRPGALARLARAEEKLDAAKQIAAIDVEVAYGTGYDAARVAVTAHMLSLGYRVRAVGGAHEAVGIYAKAMIATASALEFQRMRRKRNKAEYDDITIGRSDLAADLAHAEAIIQAVRSALGHHEAVIADRGEFFEDDEPIEKIQTIGSEPSDAATDSP